LIATERHVAQLGLYITPCLRCNDVQLDVKNKLNYVYLAMQNNMSSGLVFKY